MQLLAGVGAAWAAPKTLVLAVGNRSIMTVDIRKSPSQKNISQIFQRFPVVRSTVWKGTPFLVGYQSKCFGLSPSTRDVFQGKTVFTGLLDDNRPIEFQAYAFLPEVCGG